MSHINWTRPRQGLQLVIRRVAGSQISHIFRRASAGSEALPSLARRVSMQQHAELPCRGNKAPVPPPTLLKAAYRTIISTLEDERGQRFDADYVRGQVNYQKANAALYRYEIDSGSDPDLRAFAQQTLPKIQDHLERALKLERELK